MCTDVIPELMFLHMSLGYFVTTTHIGEIMDNQCHTNWKATLTIMQHIMICLFTHLLYKAVSDVEILYGGRMIMKDESGRMWKEVTMIYINFYLAHCAFKSHPWLRDLFQQRIHNWFFLFIWMKSDQTIFLFPCSQSSNTVPEISVAFRKHMYSLGTKPY